MSVKKTSSFNAKRGLNASFFIFAILFFVCELVSAKQSEYESYSHADSLQWQNLLHAPAGNPLIDNPQFLITSGRFSLEEEYLKNVAKAIAEPAAYFCKYPARYRFIEKNHPLPLLKEDACPRLKEFMERAPADQVSLVFAAENIASSTSMMGHVMLKLEGQSINGAHVEHAISYFTDADTYNIPRLIYEFIITGKQGFYTLSPYYENLFHYHYDEQRNVWEYQIKLSDDEKVMLAYHLYELKNINIKYFFHKYNCATLIYRILAVAKGSSIEANEFWVTPSDVVRLVVNNNLVEKTLFYPSSAGRVKIGLDALTASPSIFSQKKLSNWNLDSIEQYGKDQKEIYKFILGGYNGLLSERGLQKPERHEFNKQLINDKLGDGEVTIDVSNYKKPSDAPGDQQLRIGLVDDDKNTYYTLGFLAAGHKIKDDNRSYFSENEISLGDLTLGIDLSRKQVFIDELDLYSAKSFMPFDYFTKGKSGEMSLGFRRIESSDGRANNFFINGGIGYTARLQPDLDLSAELISEAGSVENGYFSVGYKAGLIVREIFSMKTVAEYSRLLGRYSDGEYSYNYKVTQTKYVGKSFSVGASLSKEFNKYSDAKRLSFEVVYSF